MNICLVSQNVSPGLSIFRKDLIENLVSKGHKVFALAIDYDEDSKCKIKKMGAIPVEYSLNKTGLNPFLDCIDIVKLTLILKRLEIDVVFSFFMKPSLYATLAARFAGIPRRVAMLEGLGYVYTPSSKGFSIKKRILQCIHGLLSSVCYYFADSILFLNNDDPVDLSRMSIIDKKKIKVVGPIGLNLTDYPRSQINLNKPFRFIFIARLLEEKGIFQFIDAAKIVKATNPKIEFVVLGGLDPDNPSALTSDQLDELIEDGTIIYPGYVSDVNDWISSSHVFVLPSFYREGVPRSTQEAMAIGRAVITTDVPGCRDTVVDGVNGFLIPAFSATALAEKMFYLINNSDELIRMGDESYRIASENFDVNFKTPIMMEILNKKIN